MSRLRGLWRWLRAATGDDAYERYLTHHAEVHAHARLLSRREFYVERLRRKWGGINRCC